MKIFAKIFFAVMVIYAACMIQVFAATTYEISSASGPNGKISPLGATYVVQGGSQIYQFTANSGYTLATVTIDGVKQTSLPQSWVFSNVSSNHTLSVSFVPSTYSIVATAGVNGTILPSGIDVIDYLTSEAYTITPNTGYKIAAVAVNGVNLPGPPSSYTFNSVTKNQTIKATFAAITYKITATAGAHGTITPAGAATVNYGSSQAYSIKPAAGYVIDSVSVNGAQLDGPQSSYTFTDVTENETISATFALPENKAPAQDVALYNAAIKAIHQYQSAPTAANLAAALKAVMTLAPYNGIIISATDLTGIYDDALNQLIQAVNANLGGTNNLGALTQPADADSSFASSVAVDSGSVFVSAPSNTNGFGLIYEFKKTTAGTWFLADRIIPNIPAPGDRFGQAFGVKGNFLAASSERVGGKTEVDVFTRQAGGNWVQQDILELTAVSEVSYPAIPLIHQITLAVSANQFGGYVVVGLPEYGRFMVLDQEFVYSPTTLQLLGSNWRLAQEGNFTSVSPIAVAADGDYIAVGSAVNKKVRVLKAAYVMTANVLTGFGTGNLYYTDWEIDSALPKDFTGTNAGFGSSVSLDQNPEPTAVLGGQVLSIIPVEIINRVSLAVGSPQENAGKGTVYTAIKSVKAKTFGWSALSKLSVLGFSNEKGIGSSVALNADTLVIASAAPYQAVVYQLNASSQWAWAYTLNTDVLAGIATDSDTVAVGQSIPVGKNGTSQVAVISPNSGTFKPGH